MNRLSFWEKHDCPNCSKKIDVCKCELNYCPFCDAKFGFVQDWNVHLIREHQIELHNSLEEELKK